MADRKRMGGLRRALLVFLGLLGAFVIYAYAFEQTEVEFDEIRSETRRVSLFRIFRALAQPNLISYDQEEVSLSHPVLLPCEDQEVPAPEFEEGRIEVSPACTQPGAEVIVEGSGLLPNAAATISFIPRSEFDVSLGLASIRVDENGSFRREVTLPERPAEEPQEIRVTTEVRVGSWLNREEVWHDTNRNEAVDPGEMRLSPRLSDNALRTWDKILETVMLALVATTAGTLLAVPLSFFAARNLMRDISIRTINLLLTILAVPAGVVVGVLVSGWATDLSKMIVPSTTVAGVTVLVLPLAIQQGLRWALPRTEDEEPSPMERIARVAVIALVSVAAILVLILLAELAMRTGAFLAPRLGSLRFVATFLGSLGEILAVGTPVLAAIAGAGVLMNLANRLARVLRVRLSRPVIKLLNFPLGAAAGAVVFALLGAVVGWLYSVDDPALTLLIPGSVGAVAGLAVAFRSYRRESATIGLTVYYIARTIFNTLRSIEPLVMVIVFIVWVGIGPFAGALALAVHTTAALAKLYSEQVESILPGPLEAVRATGATRLQTVVYAVVPQIVAPYISFTMYRWDINVRMSTIIGFAGGGGIGFLLQQNTNLLQYRDAAAQMLAIAIVVATMDYVSSRLRERFV